MTAGRPTVCTPTRLRRLLWMVSRGAMVREAAGELGISDRAVYRRAYADPTFRQQLTAARNARIGRRAAHQ